MSKKVLVIDDDPDVAETLGLRLESFGYEMISASNGSEGLERAKELKPDLILLDFSIGSETGIDILKQLKRKTPLKIHNIPVLMLTGHEDQEQPCLDAGAAGYITKPFDPFHLKETLSKFITSE